MTVISEGGVTTEWTPQGRAWILDVGLWDDGGLWLDGETWQDFPLWTGQGAGSTAWTPIHTGDRTDGV